MDKLPDKQLDGITLQKFLRMGADKDSTQKKKIDAHVQTKESLRGSVYILKKIKIFTSPN